MGYSGAFPSEDSSGNRIRKGAITKAGNAHLRRIVMESAWCYLHLPRVGEKLRKRHQGIPAEIIEIAWKAQNRLHKRYTKLAMGRQGSEEGYNRGRTRAARLHLGNRSKNGAGYSTATSRMKDQNQKPFQ